MLYAAYRFTILSSKPEQQDTKSKQPYSAQNK